MFTRGGQGRKGDYGQLIGHAAVATTATGAKHLAIRTASTVLIRTASAELIRTISIATSTVRGWTGGAHHTQLF